MRTGITVAGGTERLVFMPSLDVNRPARLSRAPSSCLVQAASPPAHGSKRMRSPPRLTQPRTPPPVLLPPRRASPSSGDACGNPDPPAPESHEARVDELIPGSVGGRHRLAGELPFQCL